MNTVPTPVPASTIAIEYVNIDDKTLTAEYRENAFEDGEGRYTATITREALETLLYMAGFRPIGVMSE